MKTFKIENIEQINVVAREFIKQIGDNKIFAMHGAMGVGKTTFIKAVCEELGVTDVINSPTFAIVNEYQSAAGTTIYHFDFYRIEDVQEAYDFGYEDYFYSNAYCFMEWAEKIESILPPDTIHLHFNEEQDGTRTISVEQG